MRITLKGWNSASLRLDHLVGNPGAVKEGAVKLAPVFTTEDHRGMISIPE